MLTRWSFYPSVNMNKQSGASLIEIMVSVLVISLSIMGLVSLQTLAMTSNREGLYKTQAAVLAYDIIDRMRSNPDEARDGGYVIDDGTKTGTICTTACSAEATRDSDLIMWKEAVAKELLNGKGSIEAITGSVITNAYNIKLQWVDSEGTTQVFDTGVKI